MMQIKTTLSDVLSARSAEIIKIEKNYIRVI